MATRLRDRFRGSFPAALLAFFEGDQPRAEAWLDGWVAYAGDPALAEALLAALLLLDPSSALLILRTAPVSITTDYGPEISPPLYDYPVEVVGVIAPGAPSIATSF